MSRLKGAAARNSGYNGCAIRCAARRVHRKHTDIHGDAAIPALRRPLSSFTLTSGDWCAVYDSPRARQAWGQRQAPRGVDRTVPTRSGGRCGAFRAGRGVADSRPTAATTETRGKAPLPECCVQAEEKPQCTKKRLGRSGGLDVRTRPAPRPPQTHDCDWPAGCVEFRWTGRPSVSFQTNNMYDDRVWVSPLSIKGGWGVDLRRR